MGRYLFHHRNFSNSLGQYLLPKIRDSAGQKGTGKWTAIAALNYGIPVTLIGEAVFSRCLSALKSEREVASKQLPGSTEQFSGDKKAFLEQLRQVNYTMFNENFLKTVLFFFKALYASKIVSYAQGFMLLREAAQVHNWELDYGSIALMWRGGCIIRSVFLGQIKAAFDKDPNLRSLLLAPFFLDALTKSQAGWRNTVVTAVKLGKAMYLQYL